MMDSSKTLSDRASFGILSPLKHAVFRRIWTASLLSNFGLLIMGVGAAKRFSAVKWDVVQQIILAWVLTLPVCAGLGYVTVRAAELLTGNH